MGRRTLLLVAALIVAALGTTGVFLYVDGVDRRASADYRQVNVLVATTTIAVGTTAKQAMDAGALDLRPFLNRSLKGLPALSDISTVSDQVALAPIAAGSPILTTQFGAPGQSSALPIPEGELAVSIDMDDPGRVAGFVGPGSLVVVFFTAQGNGGQEATRVLLPEVRVIAAGQTTLAAPTSSAGGDEGLPRTLLTVAVDQEQAQKIVYAAGHGRMTLGLLTDKSQIDTNEAGTTAANLFD